MKNNSISRIMAVLLSCIIFISSSAVSVYAEPNSHVIESETEELAAGYEENISKDNEVEVVELDGVGDEKSENTEKPESETPELEGEPEEETKSTGTEENNDITDQDLVMINSGIIEAYNATVVQLRDDLTEDSFSESEISDNNETFILNSSTEICTGSRRNYIKKFIVANGEKYDDIYIVSYKFPDTDVLYSMKYSSADDSVELSILVQVTSSSGVVADFKTSFFVKDNATEQMVFQVCLTETTPSIGYLASADINPAELKRGDIIDFSIVDANPEELRSEFEKDIDELASPSLELLLLGMDILFTQLFDSNITVGNFGFLTYKAPATNHIWSDWINDEGSEYRACEVCSAIDGNTDGLEPGEEWKLDAATGIQWKFSEGILTVNYRGNLEYDIFAPWDEISEDVIKLVLNEGISGFSEAVTCDLPELKEIQIPGSCINIEDVWGTFDFNDKLEKIDVSTDNPEFSSVDGVLYNKGGEKLLFYPHNKPDEIFILPDACTEIDNLYCNNLKELNLGSNLKIINSFIGGKNIVLIRVPATLQNIKGSVFDVSENLTNIIIDENNPYLCYENGALLSKDKKIIYEVMPCIDNATYTIPATVEEIFSDAFFYDGKIQNLIIPENVKKIGSGAFAQMQKIEKICLLSTAVQFLGKPFSIVDTDEAGTFYVPNEYAKILIEGSLKRCNIKNVKLIVDTDLSIWGGGHQEEEPNDSFETAMFLPMGEKILGTIGNVDKKDYYSVSIEREYANTIYIENFDNIDGYLVVYNESGRIEEMCTPSKFKYDTDSNSYYFTLTVNTTGKYYIVIQSSSLKEVPYGIKYINNSNDTSLDEEVAIESAKKYPKTVTANKDYINTLKNYIKQHGEYFNDRDLQEKQYTISEPGKTANEVVILEYDIGYDGEEWIWFSVENHHNGLSGAYEPYECLVFGWAFDSKYEFDANTIEYTYKIDSYCRTSLRTEIDITNRDYGNNGCDFKFITKNYSDISDNGQLRKNAAAMYNDAIWRWEELLERAEGKEGFKLSDLVLSGSGDLPSDDDVDNYSVYYEDQRIDLSDCTIANIKSKVYDGKAYRPMPKVTMIINGKNKKLIYGSDYRLIYTNNIKAGQGTVRVIGIGKYRGSNSQSFLITGKNIGKLTKVVGSIEVDDTLAEPIKIYDGTKLLTKGIDYEYEITDDDVHKKGTATIVVSALEGSNYTGTTKIKLPVIEVNDKILIEAADITLDTMTYNYDGKFHTPGVTVNINGTVLGKKDYSVKYKNNKNCGTACVIVKGKGKLYTGTAIAFFDIVPPTGKMSFDSAVVNKGKSLVYNGKLQKPNVVVKMNGRKLTVNKDYVLEYTNHFNAGQGKVKITGIGNYEGLSQDVYFNIDKRVIKKASIRVKSSTDYTVKYGGKILVEGIDYEVEIEEISGTNKVNMKFVGLKNFSGETIKKKVRK